MCKYPVSYHTKKKWSHEHSYYRTHDRRFNRNGTRSIVSSLYQARDHVPLSYNTRDHNTIVSYRLIYIAKSIAFGLFNNCFSSCKFCTHTIYFFTCDYFCNSSRSIFGRTKKLVAFVLPATNCGNDFIC